MFDSTNYQKQYYLLNKEKSASRKKVSRERNKEHYTEYQRSYRATHKGQTKNYNLQHDYGISVEDYDVLLKTQFGKCAICGAVESTHRYKSLNVDHDHNSNKVRGLLCHKCNIRLGSFENNLDWLRAALDYLGVSL